MLEKELYTRNSKDTASKLPPLGLGYLAAFLEKHGYEVRIWDGFYEKGGMAEILQIAREYDVLGIHVLTSFAIRAYGFAQQLKKRYPEKPIVVGGCHVSALPLEAIEKDYIDYVVVGEGERSLLDLCDALETRDKTIIEKKLASMLGVYYKNRTGTNKEKMILFNGNRPLIQDLDEIPFPARHLFNWNLYKSSEARKSSTKKDMAILTSRGCPFQCSYCAKDVTGYKVRYFSIPRVIEEIKHLIERYGIEELSIWDETFTLQRNRIIEFCNALEKENLNISWTCSSRVDKVDLELLRMMKRHGCNLIAYGIESGNDAILKNTMKGVNKAISRKAIDMTKKAGIPIRGYFMIGLWGDTVETIKDTINFACELDPDIATFSMMVPLPNTLDYTRACQQANFEKEYWKNRNFPEFNFLIDPIFVPDTLSKEQLVKLHKFAYRKFYFRPKFLIRQLKTIRSLDGIRRLMRGVRTILQL
ncbi:MAG: radical SAM protein [Candidatus Sigynarchaeota archaeon]